MFYSPFTTHLHPRPAYNLLPAFPLPRKVVLTAVVRHHAGRLAELDRRFTDVSTPGHPDHARFLTQTEALALLDPGADRLDAVIGCSAPSTSFWTISHVLLSSPPPDTRRLPWPTWWPC